MTSGSRATRPIPSKRPLRLLVYMDMDPVSKPEKGIAPPPPNCQPTMVSHQPTSTLALILGPLPLILRPLDAPISFTLQRWSLCHVYSEQVNQYCVVQWRAKHIGLQINPGERPGPGPPVSAGEGKGPGSCGSFKSGGPWVPLPQWRRIT